MQEPLHTHPPLDESPRTRLVWLMILMSKCGYLAKDGAKRAKSALPTGGDIYVSAPSLPGPCGFGVAFGLPSPQPAAPEVPTPRPWPGRGQSQEGSA